MTCIVAYVDGNVVLMSSDSCSTTDDGAIVVRHGQQKVWTLDCGIQIIVGFCGNFGNGQWVRYGFKWPRYCGMPLERWLISKVQPALRLSFITRFGPDANVDWNLIVGFPRPGRLFVLSPCGDIEESEKNFAAIGSGRDVAKGALEALESVPMYSWERLELAMAAAIQFRSDVRSPVHLEALIAD